MGGCGKAPPRAAFAHLPVWVRAWLRGVCVPVWVREAAPHTGVCAGLFLGLF